MRAVYATSLSSEAICHIPYPFPAEQRITGLGCISGFLVGRMKWTEPSAVTELHGLFGETDAAAVHVCALVVLDEDSRGNTVPGTLEWGSL